jgi:hypothetical protein
MSFMAGLLIQQPSTQESVTEFFRLLGYYRVEGGLKPTFWYYLSWTATHFKMGHIRSTETSVSNRLTARNNAEDGRIQFNRGGSLRSRKKALSIQPFDTA